MSEPRAFVRISSTPISVSGWRGAALLGLVAGIVVVLPEARALVTAGILGGIVIAAFLILLRHGTGSGPRRGTPIVLFRRDPAAAELVPRRVGAILGLA